MPVNLILLTLMALLAFSYIIGRQRSLSMTTLNNKGRRNLHSLPSYYGTLVALWAGIPALILMILWGALDASFITQLTLDGMPAEYQEKTASELSLIANEVRYLAETNNFDNAAPEKIAAAKNYQYYSAYSDITKTIVVLALAVLGMAWAYTRISPKLRARNHVEAVIRAVMIICASIAILTTIGIIFSVLFESVRFFGSVPPQDFLFGTHWSPQTAIREGQVGGSGSFGAIPLFIGTLLISLIALSIAIPFGLMSAIYLAEYAHPKFRAIAKPILEILAGIPTVVYGFFAALTVAPFIRSMGEAIGLSPSSESALAAGLVMGVMIIPFVSSLSDDVISAVPNAMRDGSYGMGATRSETIVKVIIPAALPGIVGSFLLAASRAIGETMIVVMAAGLAANLTFNPLEAVTTVTVQIVTLLTGDQEFDSPKTLAAFALGLSLFLVTLLLNFIALRVIRKYREQYD